MNGLMKKAGLGIALAATALTATAPADAQRYRGGYGGYRGYHHGDTTGAALLGGIVGLGVGAAIASSGNRGYYNGGGYYDRGYYPRGGYYSYDYRPRCWVERRYDPYYGRGVRVRVCN